MARDSSPQDLDISQFLVSVVDDIEAKERQTLSHSRSPLVLLGMANNRYVRDSSRVFQDRFSIGVMDWRMLVTLTRKPEISVTASSRIIGIDKGAVSRALGRLEARGLAMADGSKQRKWRLTPEGEALHDEMLAVSMDLHRTILKGFSESDVTGLNRLLQRIIDNLETCDTADG